jgi:hypothetical protein
MHPYCCTAVDRHPIHSPSKVLIRALAHHAPIQIQVLQLAKFLDKVTHKFKPMDVYYFRSKPVIGNGGRMVENNIHKFLKNWFDVHVFVLAFR